MGEAKRRGTFEERKAMSQNAFMQRALEQEGGSLAIVKAKILAIYNKVGSSMYGPSGKRFDERRYKRHATRTADRMGLKIEDLIKEKEEKE